MHADLVVIGGGITGIGIARDAAMRGFNVILIERNELGSGTSGNFHGQLHCGARYAVGDPQSAIECAAENKILRRVAKDAILDTGGLFLTLSEKEIEYASILFNQCNKIGISIAEISVEDVLRKEPRVNPKLKRAFMVEDGFIDGVKAISLNRDAAEKHGVQFLSHHKVTGFHQKNGRMEAVIVQNKKTEEEMNIECNFVINAAGAWAGQIGQLAGIEIQLVANKGSMIVFGNKLANSVLNHCRATGDGDILVSDGNHSILGTTSINVENPDEFEVEKHEIEKMLDEGEQMIPGISKESILRTYAGVRPLIPSIESLDGRAMTRSYQIVNHKKEGVENFVSVLGGKFTIYRLMAEKAVDAMCNELGIEKQSQTAEVPL